MAAVELEVERIASRVPRTVIERDLSQKSRPEVTVEATKKTSWFDAMFAGLVAGLSVSFLGLYLDDALATGAERARSTNAAVRR